MKRIQFIDLLRIISTIAVVVIHVTDDFVLAPNHKGGIAWSIYTFINTLSRFAVPLFILLSGYLHNETSNGSDLKKNIRKYLPLLLWFPVYWLFFYLFQPWKQNNSAQQFLLSFFSVNYLHLYFLQIILGLHLYRSIIGYLANKIYRISLIQLLCIQLVVWIFFQVSSILKVEVYYYNLFTVGLLYLPTYLMGYQLKRKKMGTRESWIVGVLSICFVFFCILKSKLLISDIYAQSFINNLSPFVIGFGILLLNQLLSVKIRKVSLIDIIAPVCLIVYLIHPLILLFVNRVIHLELHLISSNLLFWYGVKLFLVVFLSYFISYFISTVYYGLRKMK